MNYWLVKSEPDKFSWEQFVKDKKAVWDGVRNYTARNNLRAMALGDKVLFYHSNVGKEIVGIAEVKKVAYQDPTTEDINWVVVDLKPVKQLKKPVQLIELKTLSAFQNMELIRQSRLSVSKVSDEEYNLILEMGGL